MGEIVQERMYSKIKTLYDMLLRMKKCRLVKVLARCSTVVGGFGVAVKLAQYI